MADSPKIVRRRVEHYRAMLQGTGYDVIDVAPLRRLLRRRRALRAALDLYHIQHDDECNCEACNAYDELTDEVAALAQPEREQP